MEEDLKTDTTKLQIHDHPQNPYTSIIKSLGGFNIVCDLLRSNQPDNIALAALLTAIQAQQSNIWR